MLFTQQGQTITATTERAFFECCPFVVWSNDSFTNNKGDLHAHVYTNSNSEYGKIIPIYIDQIFAYVGCRYDILEELIIQVRKYHSKELNRLIQKFIPAKGESEEWTSYVLRLKNEAYIRFGGDYDYVFDFASDIFRYESTDESNNNAWERYRNAWRYALAFEHKALQYISHDGFDYSGIKNSSHGALLILELESPSNRTDELLKYSYELGKIHELLPGQGDELWAKMQLAKMEDFLKQYIHINEDMSGEEKYALSRIAIYEHCLQNETYINEAIPNDLKYRKELRG